MNFFFTIIILLFASEQISRHGYQNLEIIKILKEISAICFSIIFNLRDFSDSIQYKELLIGNGFNLTTEIEVPQHYNIDVKTLKLNSFEIGHDNNKSIPFEFVLKDSKHVIIESKQNSKTDFIILVWKVIIHKINLNWIRFGFYSWSFVITFVPLMTFLHPPSLTSIVGTLGGLLATLLAIRLRNIFEISLVERWNDIYIWMLVSIIIESIFLLFVKISL